MRKGAKNIVELINKRSTIHQHNTTCRYRYQVGMEPDDVDIVKPVGTNVRTLSKSSIKSPPDVKISFNILDKHENNSIFLETPLEGPVRSEQRVKYFGEGSCYHLHPQGRYSWMSASQLCQSNGQRLITLNSQLKAFSVQQMAYKLCREEKYCKFSLTPILFLNLMKKKNVIATKYIVIFFIFIFILFMSSSSAPPPPLSSSLVLLVSHYKKS